MSDFEIRNAEREVEDSSRRLERALERFKDQIGMSANRISGYVEAARHPTEKVNQKLKTVFGGYANSARQGLSRAREGADQELHALAERPVVSVLAVFGGAAILGLVVGELFGRREPSPLAVTEFIDKCVARWYFEKTGVQLYEEAIAKAPVEQRARLAEIRREEKRHEEMLEDVIRKYGFDPHSLTESARNTMIQSQGVVNAVVGEDFDGVTEALLTAELVDNASWDLLIKLARDIGDRKAKRLFEGALAAEAKHLIYIRELVVKQTRQKMLRRPTSPLDRPS